MDKAYTPGDIERRIYDRWETSGAFAPRGDGPAYCIMLPPPNVTGTLHMGHAFQHTLMDTLTRWHRMRGDSALWQPGTDHAGIATQMVVERQLGAEGKHRLDLGREAFIERVWKWKGESGRLTRRWKARSADLMRRGRAPRSSSSMTASARDRVLLGQPAAPALPFPDALDEGFATEVETMLALGAELAFHHHLRGDAGVIGAGLPTARSRHACGASASRCP